MLESVLESFDEQITAHEGATEHRKAVTSALKALDKASDAVALLPEDLRAVVAIDADVLAKLKSFTGGDASDLQAMANKLYSALAIVEEVGDEVVFDADKARTLLDRYKALGVTRIGNRDGSSRKGGRALPGTIRFVLPDGKVRNSSGDWTSVRYELRDHADKVQDSRIASAELDSARSQITEAAEAGIATELVIEDENGNEYQLSYNPL